MSQHIATRIFQHAVPTRSLFSATQQFRVVPMSAGSLLCVWTLLLVVLAAAAGPNSCVGKCTQGWSQNCWCNDSCEAHQNCCADYKGLALPHAPVLGSRKCVFCPPHLSLLPASIHGTWWTLTAAVGLCRSLWRHSSYSAAACRRLS